MELFGSATSFVSGVAVGLGGLWITFKFFHPFRGHFKHHNMVSWIAMAAGVFVFGGMVLGSVHEFFDPPPVAPVKVEPIAVPGANPYSTPATSPYKPSRTP